MTRVDKVDSVHWVERFDKIDRVDRVDRFDMVDGVDRVGMAELSLALPGGGKTSWESALPTSLLACPSGGWPLNLLEVRIVGTKVACNIRGWQYIVVKKTYLL